MRRLMTMEGKSLAQMAAVAIGISYAGGGIVGFAVTGFSGFVSSASDRHLFFLTLNPFQDLFHLVTGLFVLWAATRDTAVTEGALFGIGSIYVVATVAGFVGAHIPVITINTAGNPDNYLHLVTGLTALLAAVASSSATSRRRRTAVA